MGDCNILQKKIDIHIKLMQSINGTIEDMIYEAECMRNMREYIEKDRLTRKGLPYIREIYPQYMKEELDYLDRMTSDIKKRYMGQKTGNRYDDSHFYEVIFYFIVPEFTDEVNGMIYKPRNAEHILLVFPLDDNLRNNIVSSYRDKREEIKKHFQSEGFISINKRSGCDSKKSCIICKRDIINIAE